MSRFSSAHLAWPVWAALCLLLCVPLYGVGQQTREQLERERRRIEQEVQLTRKLLLDARSKQKQSIQEIQLLERQILLREKLLATMNREIEALDSELSDLERVTRAMRRDVEELQKQYGRVAYVNYKSQDNLSALLWLMSSQSFDQAYRRLMYFREFSRYRKQQIFLIKRSQQRLGSRIRQINQKRDEKQKLLTVSQNERSRLAQTRQEKDKVVQQLKRREVGYRKRLAEYRNNLRRIQREIERLIKAEIARAERAKRAAAPAARATAEANTERLSSLIEKNKGKLPWPVPTNKGTITGYFGIDEVYGGQIRNDGILLRCEPGTPVRAVFGGKVTAVQRIGATGTMAVIVQHGRIYTVYNFQAQEVKVQRGQDIETLAELGTVAGGEGEDAGQLQFCIYNEFRPVDPLQWIVRRN